MMTCACASLTRGLPCSMIKILSKRSISLPQAELKGQWQITCGGSRKSDATSLTRRARIGVVITIISRMINRIPLNHKPSCICDCQAEPYDDFFEAIDSQLESLCETINQAEVRNLAKSNKGYAQEIQEKLEAMATVRSAYIANMVAKLKPNKRGRADDSSQAASKAAGMVCNHCQAKVQNIRYPLRSCTKKPSKL